MTTPTPAETPTPEPFRIELIEAKSQLARCERELSTARAEAARLREIAITLAELVRISPSATCATLHHNKEDRHEIGKECPPLRRYSVAQKAALLALNPPTDPTKP